MLGAQSSDCLLGYCFPRRYEKKNQATRKKAKRFYAKPAVFTKPPPSSLPRDPVRYAQLADPGPRDESVDEVRGHQPRGVEVKVRQVEGAEVGKVEANLKRWIDGMDK